MTCYRGESTALFRGVVAEREPNNSPVGIACLNLLSSVDCGYLPVVGTIQ